MVIVCRSIDKPGVYIPYEKRKVNLTKSFKKNWRR